MSDSTTTAPRDVLHQGRLPDLPMIIGGERSFGDSQMDDLDPATGEPLCSIAVGTASDIDAAVQSAESVREAWGVRPPSERGRLLRALADLVRRDAEQLAHLETRDTGKPLSQGRADVATAARYFEFYGCVVEALQGSSLPLGGDSLAVTEQRPFGVTGHIVPWNYPAQISARTVGASLAAGNAVVVKPAEDAPGTPVRFAELALEAGFPAGIWNVVPGLGSVAGAALAAHPLIGHVSFTGSNATGRAVASACGARARPALLELGGKSPHVVTADANLDRATTAIIRALLLHAGQTCTAGTRVILHDEVYEEVVERIAEAFTRASIGPGLTDPEVGPLINARQRDRVDQLVQRAIDGGARVVAQGTIPQGLTGFFSAPTLLDQVGTDAEIAQQEVFGPVLVIQRYTEDAEAIAIANSTPFGLTAAVWSADIDQAMRLARRIEAGQVFINGYAPGGGVELPFGGIKGSGYGREKGFEALREYTESRTLYIEAGAA